MSNRMSIIACINEFRLSIIACTRPFRTSTRMCITSEVRPVGKACRARWPPCHQKKKRGGKQKKQLLGILDNHGLGKPRFFAITTHSAVPVDFLGWLGWPRQTSLGSPSWPKSASRPGYMKITFAEVIWLPAVCTWIYGILG